MDRYELDAALLSAGFREYEIEGVHEPSWQPGTFAYLRGTAGRWVVGVCERVSTPMCDFADEDAACRYFRDLLERATPPPPPAPLPGDEPSGLVDELRRWRDTAWAAYRRARGHPRNRNDHDAGPGPA